jgi:hypothetical protein
MSEEAAKVPLIDARQLTAESPGKGTRPGGRVSPADASVRPRLPSALSQIQWEFDAASSLVTPTGLDHRRENVLASILAGAISSSQTGTRALEIIEKLVDSTTEVVQRLPHITREHSIEHTLQPPFVKSLLTSLDGQPRPAGGIPLTARLSRLSGRKDALRRREVTNLLSVTTTKFANDGIRFRAGILAAGRAQVYINIEDAADPAAFA